MSRDLKKRGFTFVGSTICYAVMQAAASSTITSSRASGTGSNACLAVGSSFWPRASCAPASRACGKAARTSNSTCTASESRTAAAARYPRDVVLAGLLHDIIEDGGATLSELRSFGFSAGP